MTEIRDLNADERQAVKDTVSKHQQELEVLATLLNLYINGFSLTGQLNDQNSDTHWVWLFLLTRCFHSIKCSISLMQRGYYAQSIALLRMITEAYFLCGNVASDSSIADAILRNKPNQDNGTTRFNYWNLARNMKALNAYEKIYAFECKFSHFTSLSAGILTVEIDEHNRELTLVPQYDEILFMACCEMAIRNGILMNSYMEKLLAEISEDKVNNWRLESADGVKQLLAWLEWIEAKYGDYGNNQE